MLELVHGSTSPMRFFSSELIGKGGFVPKSRIVNYPIIIYVQFVFDQLIFDSNESISDLIIQLNIRIR